MRSLVIVALLVPAVAVAEPAKQRSVAVAINAPTSWLGIGHAGSLYVGINEHHAIRINAARYDGAAKFEIAQATLAAGEYDSGTDHTDHHLDVGASWTYFPVRLYNGFMIDLGLLRRDIHSIDTDRQNEFPLFRERITTTYAARAMLGVSHPVGDRGFIAWALGGSLGYRQGTETEQWQMTDPRETHDVPGWKKSFETTLRFGVVIR